jgi:septation ring formation regulator EzrA
MTENMIGILAAVATAIVSGGWAVARLMITQMEKRIDLMNHQLERQIELMNQGICSRLEETEKARQQASEQWRGLFNDLRQHHRQIEARLDHLETRIHEIEHIIHQCQTCHRIPSNLPK